MSKKIKAALFAAALISSLTLHAESLFEFDQDYDQEQVYENIIDVTDQMPFIQQKTNHQDSNWKFVPDVAHYKSADWSHWIAIAHNTTAESAKIYAESDPNITFFFYVKGPVIILDNLEVTPPALRYFYEGDAVFFSGEPKETIWWGEAIDCADGYVKSISIL